MKNQRTIVALCGDTKDMESYFEAYKSLTSQGYVVLLPGFFYFDKKDDDYSEQDLEEEKIQLLQIEKADEIFVINKENHIEKDIWHA